MSPSPRWRFRYSRTKTGHEMKILLTRWRFWNEMKNEMKILAWQNKKRMKILLQQNKNRRVMRRQARHLWCQVHKSSSSDAMSASVAPITGALDFASFFFFSFLLDILATLVQYNHVKRRLPRAVFVVMTSFDWHGNGFDITNTTVACWSQRRHSFSCSFSDF